MIKDKEIASDYLQKNQEIINLINQGLVGIQDKVAPEEFNQCRKAAGYIMYEVFQRVFVEIVREHPDLSPPGFVMPNDLKETE